MDSKNLPLAYSRLGFLDRLHERSSLQSQTLLNMILHAPFMGAGLYFEEGENEEQIKYQAAHHELVVHKFS
jgi:hypothetical protein